MTLADRIVVMNDGRIEQIGTPMDLFLNPVNTFVAGFLGSPPMNMVKARVEEGANGPVAKFGDNQLAVAQIPSMQNAVGTDVILGIRPEFVTVSRTADDGAIPVEVDLIETLGSEALIHGSLDGEPFVIRTETLGQMDILDGISGFKIDPDLIRVFDAGSGLALSGQVTKQ